MKDINEAPPLQDLCKVFNQRFLSIRIDQPNRSDCIWYVGLTDNHHQFANYFECSSTNDAHTLVSFILEQKYSNLIRGNDYGTVSLTRIVYLHACDDS